MPVTKYRKRNAIHSSGAHYSINKACTTWFFNCENVKEKLN